MADHLLVATVAFATVAALTPLVRWAARRVGALKQPGERHVHLGPTPTLGGLGLFAGLLVGIAVGSRLDTFSDVFGGTSEPEAIVLAGALVVVLGVVDDTRDLPAKVKLAGQILAAGVLVLFGVSLRYIYLPGDPGAAFALSPDLSALVSIIVVVAMMNAVNFVDGLDGLAAGIAAIAAAALLTYTLVTGGTPGVVTAAPLVLAAVVGAGLGFLVHNFSPASIFMGDTGAMLLGLLLAAGGMLATGSTPEPSGGDFAAATVPVLVPIAVLAVPFTDVVLAIVRRLRAGQSVMAPDKRHLHHRLLALGHSHRRTVLIIYYWSALLAFTAVAASVLTPEAVVALAGTGVGAALLWALARRLARAREAASGARH